MRLELHCTCQAYLLVALLQAHDTTLEMAVDGSLTYNRSGFEPLQGPISPTARTTKTRGVTLRA